jgi:methyl-accepting chemotaxis protein
MNWKKMTIGKRIAFGFGVVLALLTVVGLLSFLGVGTIVGDAEEVISGNQLDGNLAQKEVDHLNWVGKVNALLTDANVTTLQVQTDDHKCGFGKWLYGEGRKHAETMVPSLSPMLKAIEEPHRHLHESAIEIGRHFRQADLELGSFLREKKTDHLAWAHKVKDVFVDTNLEKVDAQMDPTKCSFGKWLLSDDVAALKQKDPEFAAAVEAVIQPHKQLHEGARHVDALLTAGNRLEAADFYMQQVKPQAYVVLDKIDQIIANNDAKVKGMHKANAVYATKSLPALKNVQQLLGKIREEARSHIMTDEVMLKHAEGTKRNVTIVVVVAVIAGLLLAFFIARGITAVLQKIAAQMDKGAEQVASAAGQVSSASQSLAEGSSEQAASIEETSASLEEMSSMTNQNADNAGQADGLMQEANTVVSGANDSMNELTCSMEEISAASAETSKIIKTIDEIAFQTNLLALNAAVEAARAGEAGAGFAVVADEVRNLAMRAADAAKNTADLIEGTVTKVDAGTGLVNRTNEAFTQVADSASKVGDLVAEIAAASNEQAQGIGQVNTAVTEMDRVTQQNAANAEESASASEEMNAQAQQMKQIVDQLVALVGGAGRKGRDEKKSKAPTVKTRQPSLEMPPRKTRTAAQTLNVDPSDVIPLDDGDFKDF